MTQNAFDFDGDPLQSKFAANVREFMERLIADIRHEDTDTLLENGEKIQASARCFHDVVELLIEKLPRHEAAVNRQVCWFILRILFVAFEERLASQLPPDDVIEAQAQAAIKNFVREVPELDPQEN